MRQGRPLQCVPHEAGQTSPVCPPPPEECAARNGNGKHTVVRGSGDPATFKALHHCTTLHYTTLHITAPHCTAPNRTILYCITLHCTVLHTGAHCSTAAHCTIPPHQPLLAGDAGGGPGSPATDSKLPHLLKVIAPGLTLQTECVHGPLCKHLVGHVHANDV